ncbi:MAG: glycoside hydrolase 100 family protein [Phycisphaerae bacterium]
MKTDDGNSIREAKAAALDVLRHNARGPCQGLPRTAGWGYPEPYTRDWMISALGVLVSEDDGLLKTLRDVLEALANNQTRHGHMPSLAHDPDDVGASDTTPLFLIVAALFRRACREPSFLHDAVDAALTWMRYQSPDDLIMVGQQPTSDWRDEQWVLGYGLYVNTLVYAYLRLYGFEDDALALKKAMHRFDVRADRRHRHVHEGLAIRHKPYYAMWSYKVHNSERFDLLGNSLAVLFGLASPRRATNLMSWIEAECEALRRDGRLALPPPPCLFPYVQPVDPDWRPRYEQFNRPGQYHNGGIWPFVCGFYIAALVAAGRPKVAQIRLNDLTQLVRPARNHKVSHGFNEWFDATTGQPCGQDWQTWSAAMYLYAAACVERGTTPFFDEIRGSAWKSASKTHTKR